MGGMIAATAIGIFVIPVLYLLVRQKLSRGKPHAVGHLEGPDEGAHGGAA
jgi:multidrug efflux pump